MSQTRRSHRFQALRNDLPYPFAARVDEETLSNEHIAWFTIYLLFVLNDREGIRLSRAAMQALALQPLPLPLPFPNFGRHHQSLADVIEKHRTLFSVQTESDFLEQPITLERAFFGFVRYLFLDPYEEFQTRFLNRGWNAFFARRPMKTNLQEHEEGPLGCFGQILDQPIPSAYMSTERLKELAFTYPFPNIFSPSFMDGRGAGFLTGLVTPAGARLGIHGSQRSPARRQFVTSPGASSYPRHNLQAPYTASINRPPSPYIPPRNRPISPFASISGGYPSLSRSLPLAMIPMTRSRRRDQQVLAQTGFGPASTYFRRPVPQIQGPRVNMETQHLAPDHPYRSLHRRSRQRQPIPEHMREPEAPAENAFTNTQISRAEESTSIRPTSNELPEEQAPLSQSNNTPSLNSPSPRVEEESMIIVRVERDGQSARVLVDSNDSGRQGRRVPSLQQDLGGIMDPDECTICKGSWSWIKGNNTGAPQTSPADWRLLIDVILYAASSCPTCRREYTSSDWMNQLVELGRKVSSIEPATSTPAQPETQPTPQPRAEEPGPVSAHGDDSQNGNSTRSSSSTTSLTVIRQTENPSVETDAYHEQLSEIEFEELAQVPFDRNHSLSSSSTLSLISNPLEEPSMDFYRTPGVESNLETNFQSNSTESLDSYTYDVVTAMQILSLAELLDAESEASPESVPILSDSEESSTGQGRGATEAIAVETIADEVHTSAPESRSISAASSSHSATDGSITEDSLERSLSRASISSSVTRIPRMTLSRVSMTTNDSVTSRLSPTPYRQSTRPRTITVNRYSTTRSTSSVSQSTTTSTGTVTLRDRLFRSTVKPRLPLPFSAGSTTPHAHPHRATTGSSSLRIGRLSTQTPDRSLRNENFSRASTQHSISRLSHSSTPGFLRPTKSSEAKASPQSPIKTERQKVATPPKPPRKPSWR